jgi:bromodomain-containing protein 7/9
MSSLAALPSNNNEPGTSQSHAEQSASRPTGLKLVLPPLKAGKLAKGIKRSSTGDGPSFVLEAEAKKAPRLVKLKPLKEVLTRLISQIKKSAFGLERRAIAEHCDPEKMITRSS